MVRTTSSLIPFTLTCSSLLWKHPCAAFTNNNNNSNQLVSSSTSTVSLNVKAEESSKSRRAWLKDVSSAMIAGSFLVGTQDANALVFYDPDRYGDKELKIATVNKLRQNVRDAIVADPSMASQFLKIAVQDALSYNSGTEEGGPDGTIIDVILAGDKSVEGLKPGATKISEIAKKIKRTTEVTMGDVVEFAGAEAIETCGGPRIPIQLGKIDPSKRNSSGKYVDLCKDDAGKEVVSAFVSAGLTEREVALIYGALGSMEASAASFKKEEDDFEENEMGDEAIYIPNSFGSPKEMYGTIIGSMDNSVFKSVVKDIKQKKRTNVGVFNDEKVVGWAQKYAGNNNGFLKDLPEAYTKVMSLGRRYTGGKVGSLLGGDEPTY